MKKRFASISLMVFAAACTTPTEKLDSGAREVTVLNNVTLTELEKLKKIGSGSCQIGANAHTAATNQEACTNYLRNEAAKKNADYIVIVDSSKQGMTTAVVEADFYQKRPGY